MHNYADALLEYCTHTARTPIQLELLVATLLAPLTGIDLEIALVALQRADIVGRLVVDVDFQVRSSRVVIAHQQCEEDDEDDLKDGEKAGK